MMMFNMTEYRKIVWIDADVVVLKNLDHLFLEPTFTASMTHAWWVVIRCYSV